MEGADLRVFVGIVERFKKSCLITFRQNQAGLGLAQGQNKGFFHHHLQVGAPSRVRVQLPKLSG